MKKVAITGSNGRIGNILKRKLTDYKLTLLDLPENDITDYERLLKTLPGHDAVVHLAWNKDADWKSESINPDNSIMFSNVYRAAFKARVPRLIMASSVHADNYQNWRNKKMLHVNKIPIPDGPYGANKVFMESLGRYYATKGPQIICIRFGSVYNPSRPPWQDVEKIGLTHNDCIGLIKKCIETDKIPNFVIIYGVSKNKKRIHDYSNPLGWEPKEDAEDFYIKEL